MYVGVGKTVVVPTIPWLPTFLSFGTEPVMWGNSTDVELVVLIFDATFRQNGEVFRLLFDFQKYYPDQMPAGADEWLYTPTGCDCC